MLAMPTMAMCVMTQNSNTDGHPIATYAEPEPLIVTDGATVICPEFQNASCCNAYQNDILAKNLQSLYGTLGAPSAGGCPACFHNLRTLFCQLTCGSDQGTYS